MGSNSIFSIDCGPKVDVTISATAYEFLKRFKKNQEPFLVLLVLLTLAAWMLANWVFLPLSRFVFVFITITGACIFPCTPPKNLIYYNNDKRKVAQKTTFQQV